MKKLLSVVVVLLACVGTHAQIVSSRSSIVKYEKVEKEPSNTTAFVRAGMNIMNMAGDGAEDLNSKMGYNVMIGFAKPIGTGGAYWGMDFGQTSRGFTIDGSDDVKCIAHAIQYSPFTFGFKINVGNGFAIDPHLGAFISYDYTSKMKFDDDDIDWSDFADAYGVDYLGVDAGFNLGVGVWYKRYNLDFSYQRGFIDVFSDFDGIKSSNFMIRLGVGF